MMEFEEADHESREQQQLFVETLDKIATRHSGTLFFFTSCLIRPFNALLLTRQVLSSC